MSRSRLIEWQHAIYRHFATIGGFIRKCTHQKRLDAMPAVSPEFLAMQEHGEDVRNRLNDEMDVFVIRMAEWRAQRFGYESRLPAADSQNRLSDF